MIAVSIADAIRKESITPIGIPFAKPRNLFADASERAIWIDTDDLNGEKQELHYIKPEGYEKLGERYVEAAVMLVQAK